MRKINTIFLSLLVLLLFSGCTRPVLFKETRLTMDTFAEISCFSGEKDVALTAIDGAFKEIEHIEKLFSKFDRESEVSKINMLAGAGDIKVSPELFGIIERSIYYSNISGGSFDITVRPGVKGRYKDILLDKDRLSVLFVDDNIKIDLGAIAKGYAVDRAKEILESRGIKSALINIGGNIFAMASPPGKKSWRIGIQDPLKKGKVVYKLELKDKGIATSGDYERPFHIIDPQDGKPADNILSVTVISDSAERADALSTAIFVMGIEKAKEFMKSFKDIDVLILDKEGNMRRLPR